MTRLVHRAARISQTTRARQTTQCPVCCHDVSPGDRISQTVRGWAHAHCTARVVTIAVKDGIL